MFLCLTLKYTFICVYWWTRQRIHITLIVVDRYMRLTWDKTIPDSAEPRLESFYPPFIAGIDLPHQGVVDFYSLVHVGVRDKRRGLRSIYLSLGMRQLFGDVTMGQWRHNQPTWLSNLFITNIYRDLRA